MSETEDTIVVFTARSPDRIVKEGGSQAWVLNPVRAKQSRWLVCTQNQRNPDHEFSDATEPHGTGFLLGKISSIVHAPESSDGSRWMIAISEFARIDLPGAWDHGRNPVRYASLKELGIDLAGIEFQPMLHADATQSKHRFETASPTSLTIAEAKKALAVTFGVKPEAIEITIRG